MKDKKKSKRTPLKQKYSVQKKVTEHNRRLRKVANGPDLKKRFRKKDSGIPNSWPYKAEMLQDIHKRKENLAAEKARLKKEKRERQIVMVTDSTTMEETDQYEILRKNAEKAASDFTNARSTSVGIESKSVNSTTGFLKILRQVIESADVVVEVLDARDPQSCRNPQIERQIVAEGKKLILLLNKIDLVPREVVDQWTTYLRKSFPTLTFKSALSTNTSRNFKHTKGLPSMVSESELQISSQVVGAPALLQLVKNYSRIGSTKTKMAISVGFIGVPNVGKSSIINSLCRNSNAARVGGEAGVTRHFQEIFLDSRVKLIDSPGVIVNSSETAAEIILRNAVKISMVEDPIFVIDFIVQKYPVEQIMMLFKVPVFSTTSEFLGHVAKSKGKLSKGGSLDLVSAARLVLTEWVSGKIQHFVLPPPENVVDLAAEESGLVLGARVVSNFSAPFDIDALMR